MDETQGNIFSQAVNWRFLGEPLSRWGIFFLAVSAMTYAYKGALDIMKE